MERLHRHNFLSSASRSGLDDFVVWFFCDFGNVSSQLEQVGADAVLLGVGVVGGAQGDDVVQHQLIAHRDVFHFKRQHHFITSGDQVGQVVQAENSVKILTGSRISF